MLNEPSKKTKTGFFSLLELEFSPVGGAIICKSSGLQLFFAYALSKQNAIKVISAKTCIVNFLTNITSP